MDDVLAAEVLVARARAAGIEAERVGAKVRVRLRGRWVDLDQPHAEVAVSDAERGRGFMR